MSRDLLRIPALMNFSRRYNSRETDDSPSGFQLTHLARFNEGGVTGR